MFAGFRSSDAAGGDFMSGIRICILLTALSCAATAVMVRAQHDHEPPALPASFKEAMPLYPRPNVLGAFTRHISSSNVDAQRYFDQGFQLMYAFDKYDAIRSFREA